jgi:hypothetical protein
MGFIGRFTEELNQFGAKTCGVVLKVFNAKLANLRRRYFPRFHALAIELYFSQPLPNFGQKKPAGITWRANGGS